MPNTTSRWSGLVGRLGVAMVVLAAGLLAGTTLTFGLAAGSAFATLRALQPSLTDPARSEAAPDFAAVPFDEGQPNYLAGRVVNALTHLALRPIAITASVLVVVGLVLRHVAARRPPWLGYALAGLAITCLIVALANQSRMDPLHAVMYDAEATAEQRQQARATFDDHHKVSERLFGVIALSHIALVVTTAFAAATPAPKPAESA